WISCLALTSLSFWFASAALADEGRVELRPYVFKTNDSLAIEFWSGKKRVGLASSVSPAGIEIRLPGGEFIPVQFTRKVFRGESLVFGPTPMGGLDIRLRLRSLNPSLIERTLEVTATVPQKFAARFEFFPADETAVYGTFSETTSQHATY